MFHGLRIPGFYLPRPFPWPRDSMQGLSAELLPGDWRLPSNSNPARERGSMSLGAWLWGSVLPRVWVLSFLFIEQEENQAPGGEAE